MEKDKSDFSMDFLPQTELSLRQRKDMFRINTDTYLLGEWIKIRKSDTVLDIGCNNGALMLYALDKGARFAIGVDIFEEALQLAEQNLCENGFDQFELVNADICEYRGKQVDVIVCNPPYFAQKQHKSRKENPFLAVARHENTLTLESLMITVKRLLKDNGRFYLVHRASRLFEIESAATAQGLKCRTMQLIYDENKDRASTVLMEFGLGEQTEVRIETPRWITRTEQK